jgi:hypothetical protein
MPASIPRSHAARRLRFVLDRLVQDLPLMSVDPATLPWDRPILVLRSATMERLQALLEEIIVRCPMPALHIMSHARDEDAIRSMAPCGFTFHAYPATGPYRLEGVPAAMLDDLRAVGFGTVFGLDAGTWGDRLEEVDRVLAAIREPGMVSFRGDGTYARAADWRQRRRAESAFLRLLEWYQFKLDPGFPDGPVQALDAPAASSVLRTRAVGPSDVTQEPAPALATVP